MPLTQVGRVNLRSELIALANQGVTINEVSLSNGQSLFGVTILAVEGDFVVFSEAGSAGITNVIVDLADIVFIDTTNAPIPPNI
ncbi:hypothetical protein [Caenibacillus caldisaponilyticus]|uniref:hypothetical protein n=1 Tax=Caenibacillus caldisaponilyticus TaxID=1674942 RepID=UPI00098865B0|nr:hypothetical protein [Caenibacillus caldisaponilyticus]